MATKAKKAAAKKAPEVTAPETVPGIVWRLATVTNPKSEREITLELRKNGLLVRGDRERMGMESVDAWTEIKAISRVEALAGIKKGQGTAMRNGTAPKSRRRKKK